MSGLNVLLWTIAILLILGAIITIAAFIGAIVMRKKAIEEYKAKPSLWDKLNEAQTKQNELLRKANKIQDMSNKIELFKQKAYKRVEAGLWVYEWHVDKKHPERSQMRVMSTDGLFDLRLSPEFNSFGYLLAAAEKGMNEQLESYGRILFSVAALDTLDQELDNDLWSAIYKWEKRKEAEGAERAKNVTEADEMGAQAFMNDIVAESTMSKRELTEKRKEDAALLKEILSEKGEGE
ncbi:MAG: hypothetical protein NC548_62835 [Lachnospiraceae bacterium]|nr:hypothetical protein [Lachnospiraceae bacterium]